jgi:DNA-binding CsgD family transcriptional regulator
MPPAGAARTPEASRPDVEEGRRAYVAFAWTEAHASLSRADAAMPLTAADVELLATSAYMLGREDEWLTLLERAHHAHLDGGDELRAVRCAFWIGTNLALRGELGPATGWLGRAQRLFDREPNECVERGYLLLPLVFRHEATGDLEAASSTAAEAAAIGERFSDRDLFALAVHEHGNILIRRGRVAEGLGLLDEAMVAVTAGEVSPMVAGLVYCGVILACQEVYEVRRAREWTAALTRWCERQPDLLAFTGRCLVHRAEILQLHGAWGDALEEARRAAARLGVAPNAGAAAQAAYRQGEVHRLLGDFDAAEAAFREANRRGHEPQPGLALLRLAQGRGVAAAAAIRRVVGETEDRLRRATLLPAYVQIMLAVGDTGAARTASHELAEISTEFESPALAALSSYAEGAVSLAEDDAQAAVVALRHAWQAWQEIDAPYEAARARVLLGLACRVLGDDDAAELELEAARGVFEILGAAPDVVWVDALSGLAEAAAPHGLTARECEVLRLVATGRSNKEIAAELVISEHTVARHVQNLFRKLDVSSRAAAGAFAFQHGLA